MLKILKIFSVDNGIFSKNDLETLDVSDIDGMHLSIVAKKRIRSLLKNKNTGKIHNLPGMLILVNMCNFFLIVLRTRYKNIENVML